MFADELDNFLQMGGAFFNLLATKFAFYEGVAAVAKVEDQVGFQAVTVVIVRQFTAEVLGVGSEVPCAHVFEDEAEGLQLGLQRLGSGSEGCNGDGRVCEFSLEAAADSTLVADGRAPGFQVIDDKELVERAHVVVEGVHGEVIFLRGHEICAHGGFLCEGGNIPGPGSENHPGGALVTLDAVHAGDIIGAKGAYVFCGGEELGLGRSGIQGCGPPAAAGQKDKVFHGQRRMCAVYGVVRIVEEFPQGDLSAGFLGFPEAHRKHLHPGDASGAAVLDFLFVHDGGAGEDVEAYVGTAVNGVAHSIPQVGGILPFVDEPGILSAQQQRGFDGGGGQIFGCVVLVLHLDDALCLLGGCRCLATPFGPFHEYGSEGIQTVRQHYVGGSFKIFHFKSSFFRA